MLTKNYKNTEYLINTLIRFKHRFHFKKPFTLNITNFSINPNEPSKYFMENYNKFNKLQLYHSSIIGNTNTARDIIFKNTYNNGCEGFDTINHKGKIRGVKFLSHSRHSYFLAMNHVYICEVLADKNLIDRYIADIYSPYNNNEYVVRDTTKIVYPILYFQYKIDSDMYKKANKVYTYYLNNGAGVMTFYQSNVTPGAIALGIHPDGGNYGSIWIDYDNDGDQDLFIAKCRGGAGTAKFNELHRNNGNGTFSDVSTSAAIPDIDSLGGGTEGAGYVAVADLIPELHKTKRGSHSFGQLFFLVLGIILMIGLVFLE
jgi:hypothetical protein